MCLKSARCHPATWCEVYNTTRVPTGWVLAARAVHFSASRPAIWPDHSHVNFASLWITPRWKRCLEPITIHKNQLWMWQWVCDRIVFLKVSIYSQVKSLSFRVGKYILSTLVVLIFWISQISSFSNDKRELSWVTCDKKKWKVCIKLTRKLWEKIK